MTKIKPFRALTYNPQMVKDISQVVCPPYDIISPQAQEHYHQINPYNFIHILLGKDLPDENKYVRAAAYLRQWLKDEILIRDKNPSIYFYSQEYYLKGEKRRRLGFISLLKIENTSVFGHEHTRIEPKEDRLNLIKEVRANLSPIFVIFSDKKRIIQYMYQRHIQYGSPFMDITDDEKTVHKLWRLDSPELLRKVEDIMSDENIFIADGHHRYEVACVYKEEMMQKTATANGEEGFNYILSYFTNLEPKGLSILPIHRLVKLKERPDLESLMNRLNNYFDIEEIKDRIRFFFLLEKAGFREHVLGMHSLSKFWLLRLKNIKILDKLISDKPREYRSQDVSILNYIVLKDVLGLNLDDRDSVTFEPNTDELLEKVNNHPAHIAFFLNPVKIQDIMALALNGEKMPPKSTYFYPKVLSGLVINKFNEDKS